ncbi:MAG: glycosyltransferase [Synechococcus sp.]|nr:glycosyltransferase [Synechococcus sp.]
MEKKLDYPNVLVVSESPFSLDNGFGVTLNSFFDGWPSDRLGLFYMSDTIKLSNRKLAVQSNAHIPSNRGRRFALSMLIGEKPEWRSHYSRIWLHKHLKNFQPDLIYTFFHSDSTLHFGAWIADQLHIPHTIHAGDDSLGSDLKTINAIKNSRHCIAISDEMAIEYLRRYGRDFKVFRNGASSEYYPPSVNIQPPQNEIKTIRYLGRLYPWLHFDSLRLLDLAVDACRTHGIHWHVELYGSADLTELISSGILSSNISYKGSVGHKEGVDLLRTADLLVVPLTYDDAQVKSYKYSFPTKLSQFLATGRPVLILSDPATASALFCKRHGVGKLITTPAIDEIISYLTLLWDDSSTGNSQGVKNIRVCRKLLDLNAIRSAFQALLASH